MPFLLIFVGIPLLEIAVFIWVGQYIGVGWTLLFALVTAIIGGSVVKYQGLKTLEKLKAGMKNADGPLGPLFDGACLLVSGATLITPGFVTDAIGFLLLVPQVRSVLRKFLSSHVRFAASFSMPEGSAAYRQNQDPGIIEGEFEVSQASEDSDRDEDSDHKKIG